MKKTFLLITILFLAAVALFAQEEAETAVTAEPTAQITTDEFTPNGIAFNDSESDFNWNEYPWNVALGAEYASNTRDKHIVGFGLSLDRYLFCPWLALAFGGMLHNNETVSSTEVKLALRLYLPEIPYFKRTLFFAQWGSGYSMYREEDRQINSYMLDIAVGARLRGAGALDRFYLEPYIRTGFPSLFSAGILAGRRFNF